MYCSGTFLQLILTHEDYIVNSLIVMFWWWDNFQVEVKFSHTSLVLSGHNVCVCVSNI